jgi:hypothetical protein
VSHRPIRLWTKVPHDPVAGRDVETRPRAVMEAAPAGEDSGLLPPDLQGLGPGGLLHPFLPAAPIPGRFPLYRD